MADFSEAPIQYVHEVHYEAGGRGVWHFTPDDWETLVSFCGPGAGLSQPSRLLLGQDVVVSEAWTTPPRLVSIR